MPIGRLIFILVLVMALAAATIAIVVAATDTLSGAPMATLGLVGLAALCASFAWRWVSDSKAKAPSGDK